MEIRTNYKRIIIGIIIKALSVIFSIYGVIKSYSGPMIFTYFTVLSNLYLDIMLLIFLYKDIYYLITKKELVYKRSLYVIKYTATISIILTFLVFNTILAPFYPGGVMIAYFEKGAYSLCLHVLAPLLGIIDYIVFDRGYEIKYSDDFFTLLPPLLYLILVIILGQSGVRWSNMIAPYNFINYGAEVGWFGFNLNYMGWESLGIGVFYMIVIVCLIILGIGRVILWVKKRRKIYGIN